MTEGMTRLRRLARDIYAQLGVAYFRIVAVGGTAAIAFLAIWPLSTVLVVVLVAVGSAVVAGVRRRRSGDGPEDDPAPR